MNKFLMICYVAALFTQGELKFEITAGMRGTFIEAPEWIKDTLLFKWLLSDGSIKVAEEQISKKQGENDPMKGMSAEGKNEEVTEAHEAEMTAEAPAEEEPKPEKKTKATRKKGDAK